LYDQGYLLTAVVKESKNVLFPGPGDAIGFWLKVIQELACSTPVHIIYKFIDFRLWQETGIHPPHYRPTNKKSLY
jgi:hypothetical protein